MKNNTRAYKLYSILLNNFVYHETAHVLSNGGVAAAANDDIDQIISRAHECIRVSKDIRLIDALPDWFNTQETAAFALIKIGDQASQSKGRQLLRDIFAGRKPTPAFQGTPPVLFKDTPRDWLVARWDEYFPVDAAGGRVDSLGLGQIPRP